MAYFAEISGVENQISRCGSGIPGGIPGPGVEFKSVGVRVKSVGVEFEILLTCLGCGYAMLFKLGIHSTGKKNYI